MGYLLLLAQSLFWKKSLKMFNIQIQARQGNLASRQGVGKVRHLSGKILWVQEKVFDGTVSLRQVPTVWNVADIGTKCLGQQRMMVLMHETGLVYIQQENQLEQRNISVKVKRLAIKSNSRKSPKQSYG